MKTKIFSLLFAVIACLGLAACNDDNWDPNGWDKEGSVSFATMSLDVDDATTEVSRAGISTDNFIVTIKDKTSGAVRRTYKYGTMPEVVSLPVGSYTVSVKSHEIKPAEFEAPYYVGSADFSIEAGKITEIGSILCKFMSIKVTIKYTKELASKLGESAHVKVVANDRGELDFVYGETRSGYFEAVDGSSTLVAEFFANINGNDVYAIKSFGDVTAGQHHIITFSIKNGTGTIPDEYGQISQDGITIDANIEHEDVSSNTQVSDNSGSSDHKRPGDEEWPDEPGPDDPVDDPISFITELKLGPSTNDVVAGNKYIVNIKADNGIENLKVNISSTNEGFIASAGEMLPMSFDLAHLDDELFESLASIGLEGNDAVLGKKKVPFEITELVPLLGAFPGTHTFTIEVTDKADPANNKSMSLIFVVK